MVRLRAQGRQSRLSAGSANIVPPGSGDGRDYDSSGGRAIRDQGAGSRDRNQASWGPASAGPIHDPGSPIPIPAPESHTSQPPQLLDERRALDPEQIGRPVAIASRSLERSLNEVLLDRRQI